MFWKLGVLGCLKGNGCNAAFVCSKMNEVCIFGHGRDVDHITLDPYQLTSRVEPVSIMAHNVYFRKQLIVTSQRKQEGGKRV